MSVCAMFSYQYFQIFHPQKRQHMPLPVDCRRERESTGKKNGITSLSDFLKRKKYNSREWVTVLWCSCLFSSSRNSFLAFHSVLFLSYCCRDLPSVLSVSELGVCWRMFFLPATLVISSSSPLRPSRRNLPFGRKVKGKWRGRILTKNNGCSFIPWCPHFSESLPHPSTSKNSITVTSLCCHDDWLTDDAILLPLL